ncbi:MAG: hypothetical protein COU68_03940, partial [Candidatus Pacebacteria bacterium CG10_big_fil_rev_8_21_14_0_10_45_6]
MFMLWLLLVALFLFLLGAAIGSFLNVVIYRSNKEESWVKGRSYCESCGKQIAWYDNIPLLSYFVLQGKCRHCKDALSITHPAVEFLTGILFVWWYFAIFMFFKLTQQPFVVLQPVFWLCVGIILLAIFIIDLRTMIIPNTLTIALFVIVLLYRVGLVTTGIMQVQDFWLAVLSMIGAAAFFFGIWALTRGKGMGFGDVKLAAPLGLLLGWPAVMVWLFAAFIIGGVVGIGLLFTKKAKMKQAVPFGPFLIIGTFIALIWGSEIYGWY